jgi:hypothetical protein
MRAKPGVNQVSLRELSGMKGLGLGEIEQEIRKQSRKLEALRDDARASRMAFCLELSALIYGVDVGSLLQEQRCDRRISDARQLSMYLANISFGMGYTEIGWYSGRDRGTVRHGIERVEDRRENPGFDALVSSAELLISKLKTDSIAKSISDGVRIDLGAEAGAIDEIWQQPLHKLLDRDA